MKIYLKADCKLRNSRPLGNVVKTKICGLIVGLISYKMIGYNTTITCQIDYCYMCIGTDCQKKSIAHTNVDFIYYNNCLQHFPLSIKQ